MMIYDLDKLIRNLTTIKEMGQEKLLNVGGGGRKVGHKAKKKKEKRKRSRRKPKKHKGGGILQVAPMFNLSIILATEKQIRR